MVKRLVAFKDVIFLLPSWALGFSSCSKTLSKLQGVGRR